MIPQHLIVGARGCEEHLVKMNRGSWETFFPEIIIVTPEDDLLPGAQFIVGKSGHIGPEAIDRMLYGMKLGAQWPCVALSEPDVVFFDFIDVADGEIVSSQIHPNIDPRFSAPEYPHAPIIATRKTLRKLLDTLPGISENETGDRVLAAACIASGITMRGVGFSRNTIDTPHDFVQACAAVRNGAKVVHGVKSAGVALGLDRYAGVERMPLGW